MPSKNKKQLNFFLLVKAYKESGEMGVKRQWKFLEGPKPRLTNEYMEKLNKTALSIKPADLIDLTSGINKEDIVGDKREIKAGYWALFRGKYKPRSSNDEIPKEAEFIAQIKRVDIQKGVVNFNHNGFRNKFGQTMEIPKRANISSLEHIYLDYALFDNIIRTGKTPQEVARQKESISESIILKSKSKKGNRLFQMLKTAKFQHYDSPKGELSTFNKGEEDRKRLVSKLNDLDKKTYKEWIKTPEGMESLKKFNKFTSPLFKEKNMNENIRTIVKEVLSENLFNISDNNLMPDDIIDTFYSRIEDIIKMGAKSKEHPSIERELVRIRRINNNIIPKKIQTLLDSI